MTVVTASRLSRGSKLLVQSQAQKRVYLFPSGGGEKVLCLSAAEGGKAGHRIGRRGGQGRKKRV